MDYSSRCTFSVMADMGDMVEVINTAMITMKGQPGTIHKVAALNRKQADTSIDILGIEMPNHFICDRIMNKTGERSC
ncbi:MAG: hypothetical protein WBO10_10165 [Pyrinomonadaceae bacterium]